ncbi:hypothetical protein TRFO_14634 [Tritrichomonas foetus]|uniref:Uncharacterized protein n=1 Tax=Tritrichomonas foetus TaxID=1144522 RepID=A0A1J4KV10_9EUKA|nr:hypothetical protein TRFO_14634 [Tritrichomonas foetus]|eukprot:OHT14970.1 hypothetical protein TRFO_14634 [Tritrichomonas foetus]
MLFLRKSSTAIEFYSQIPISLKILDIKRMIIPILFVLFQRRTQPLYDKIKDELEEQPSEEKDDLAIKWALAQLSQHVSSTVTSNQVEYELSAKMHDLIERVEIADAALKRDFNQMKIDFIKTRQSIVSSVETMKVKILDDINYFINEFNYSVLSVVEASIPNYDMYVDNSKSEIGNFYKTLGGTSFAIAVMFFIAFQIMLIFGIVNFHKIYRAISMLV